MKKPSNFLCIILSATMLLSLLSVSVSAQTAVTVFNITVDEPTVGQELATTASLPETASTYVSKLRWTGDLDENGKVKADYTNGLRIWVHSPKSGYQKASENPDNKTDWLPTTYPFADFNMWVRSSDFKAIKDLKPDDEANFNKFYGK